MSKIKVYVKSETIDYEISGQLAVEGHPCLGFRKEIVVRLPEDHERAKRIAEDVAKEEQLDIEICDLSNSLKNRMSAFFRGIEPPMVEIGDKRTNGVLNKEKLQVLLREETLKR